MYLRATVSRIQETESAARNPLISLSEQERRVLAQVATGKTDKEVALALDLQAKTVRNYLAQVYRKLGIHTRTHAAIIYQQNAGETNAQE